MMIARSLSFFWAAWLFIASVQFLHAKPCQPNVLFLFTDDQRFDTIHALGNEHIHTPHTDRLVKSGVAFKNAYIMGGSSPAVCSPSRASLFSGLTLWNLDNQGLWGFEISDKYKTMPQVFRENGYVTFATGKNEPGQRGHFARSFSAGDKILFRGMTRNQYRLPLFSYSPEGDYSNKNAKLHEGKHSSEVYADACIRFLKDHKESDQPFFAYVSFQTPHDPKQSPEKYRSMYKGSDLPLPPNFKPEHPFDNGMLRIRDEMLEKFPRQSEKIKDHIAAYYAMVTHTDAQMGRILEVLEETGKMENTIIVFTSDNGLGVGSHGLMGKQNVYDHSVHVPLVIAGPGIPKGETRDALCYIYDLYPTLCERAALQVPKEVEFKSFNSVLKDSKAEHREYLYFAFMSWQRAVQKDDYKLIEYCVKGKRHTQLFNLSQDPHETNNLAANPNQAKKLAELRSLLEQERVRLNDGNSTQPFTDKQGKDFWGMYESVKESTIPE